MKPEIEPAIEQGEERRVMRWYVSQNGRTSGPFAEERLVMLLNWGKISKDAYICDEQWSTWIAIRRSGFAPLLKVNTQSSSPPERRSSNAPPLLAGLHRFLLAGLMLVAAALTLAGGVYQRRGISPATDACTEVGAPAGQCVYPGGSPEPFGIWP